MRCKHNWLSDQCPDCEEEAIEKAEAKTVKKILATNYGHILPLTVFTLKTRTTRPSAISPETHVQA